MMNKNAKKELVFILGLTAYITMKLKSRKAATAIGFAAGALALIPSAKPNSMNGKVVGITGGSRGLGIALAKNLLQQGAVVHLIARDAVELNSAKEILVSFGSEQNIFLIPCDITIPEDLTNAITKIYRTCGRIDFWINNAGAILVGPFDSMTKEDFTAQMNLHLYANIQATQELIPVFRRQAEGQIINICSLGSKVAIPHMLPYDTSKFALAGFSKGITAELAQDNITVTTVYPATLRTGSPIQAVFKGDAEKEYSWFANADVLPGLSTDANVAAQKIIQAALERQTELVLPAMARVRLMADVLFPELTMAAMGLLNQLLPQKNSLRYRTGADVKNDSSYLMKSFLQTEDLAEAAWNQKPRYDAEFNLGIE